MSSKLLHLGRETLRDFMEDKAMRLSAAIAYYSAFSLAPLLVIAISVAGIALGEEAVSRHLRRELGGYVGPQASEALLAMVHSAAKRGGGWLGTIAGILTLLIGATGIFGQLKDALNTIWEVRVKPGGNVLRRIVIERILSFGMVLVIGFLLLVSLLVTTALAGMSEFLGDFLRLPTGVWAAISLAVSFAIVSCLFALLFKVLPDARVSWAHAFRGAAVTALLFEIGKFALSFYLGRESTASGFGAAASVVLLLMWVYYACCILLLGAEFTQALARLSGHAITPKPGAEPVRAGDRVQKGLDDHPAARKRDASDSPPPGARASLPLQTPGRTTASPPEAPSALLRLLIPVAVGFVLMRAVGPRRRRPQAR